MAFLLTKNFKNDILWNRVIFDFILVRIGEEKVATKPIMLFPKEPLVMGFTGPGVAGLQIILLARGLNRNIVVDGRFGEQTELGEKEWESQLNLCPRGEFDLRMQNTLAATKGIDVSKLRVSLFRDKKKGKIFPDSLRKGDRGSAVAILQLILKMMGFNSAINIDSVFGDQTELGVKQWEESISLTGTGVVDAILKQALLINRGIDLDALNFSLFWGKTQIPTANAA